MGRGGKHRLLAVLDRKKSVVSRSEMVYYKKVKKILAFMVLVSYHVTGRECKFARGTKREGS